MKARRPHRILCIGLACALVAPATFAQPKKKPAPAAGASDADPTTEQARLHFKNGVKLFQDTNYPGALAEFEAAYRLKPGASSLKNIALCLKALFRYGEAADALNRVLSVHGKELSPEEKTAIESAIGELSSLVGSIVVRVTPSDARVFVDGRYVDPKERASGIGLNTGEHTLSADAAGYTKISRAIRVAGGQKNVLIELALQAVAGFVRIKTEDPQAAIAIDQKPLSLGEWSGAVSAGRHYVQVYREGFVPFEQAFVVEVGRSQEISAPVLEKRPEGVEDPAKPPVKLKQVRGFYGVVALSGQGLRGSPGNLKVDESNASGAAFGVRAGYRLWTPIAAELMLESARHDSVKACDESAPGSSCDTNPVTRTFSLDSLRIGPNLRIMSAGDTLRFTSTVGVGAVRHQIELDHLEDQSKEGLPADEAHGWDPYFLLEIGIQYNWGHVLLELAGLLYVDGASNVKSSAGWAPYKDTGGLLIGGLGLKAGWSEWTPDSSKKP